MTNTSTRRVQSSGKTLDVLAALLEANFLHGLSSKELCQRTGLPAPDMTRHVATLLDKGFAERIAETGRLRASHSLAKHAVHILSTLDAAERRLAATRQTLNLA